MTAKIYGHRGAAGEQPENSLAAFRHAQSHGAAGIETDIAVTADFVPVLHHDPGLPGGQLIKNCLARDLPAYIPTLAQALATAPGLEWLLEVKTYPAKPGHTHPPARMAEHILAVLAASPAANISILAFDWAVLRVFAALAPQRPRICLTAPDMSAARKHWWGPGFAGLSVPQAVAQSGAQGWAAEHNALTEAEIVQAHDLGLKIFAWTVNDPKKFARLAPRIDGIITDYPSRMMLPKPLISKN